MATRVGATLVVGFIEEDGDDLYDSLLMVSPSGLLGVYRKSHLYPPEFAVFSAGTTLDVVQTPTGVVGPLVCFEHAFPDVATTLALAGAQILVIPSAVPLDYEHLLHLRTRARAQDNQVFAIGCNMTGHGFAGRSLVADPRGEVLAEAGEADRAGRRAGHGRSPERTRARAIAEHAPAGALPRVHQVTAAQKKPYDLGNGVVCASFGTDGSWLSMGRAHPRAGLVELSGAPAFPAERDGQVDLVRAHRAHLTDPATAMLRVGDARTDAMGPDDEWRLHGADWSARAKARSEGTGPTIVQRYLVTADGPAALRLEFGGRLDRPAYAEITPGGPIPPALPPQAVEAVGATLAGANAGATTQARSADRGHLAGGCPSGPGPPPTTGSCWRSPGRSRSPTCPCSSP